MSNMQSNTDLHKFVQRINLLDNKSCTDIIEHINKARKREHKFYNVYKKETEFENSPKMVVDESKEFAEMSGVIVDMQYKFVSAYITEFIKMPWFTTWAGYTPPKFLTYSKGEEMEMHCDHIHSINTEPRGIPILTIICLLNDNFEGGEIHLIDKNYKLKTGEAIIFPSNFLYPHKINPVKEGVRHSMSTWVY